MDAFVPGLTEVGTLAYLSWSTVRGVGPLEATLMEDELTFDDGFGFELVDAEGVPEVVGLAEGEFDADGVGVGVVSARPAGAVPLTRTIPVPTLMISGLRTDRASTAYNLLNDRHGYRIPGSRHGSGKNHAITSELDNQPAKAS